MEGQTFPCLSITLTWVCGWAGNSHPKAGKGQINREQNHSRELGGHMPSGTLSLALTVLSPLFSASRLSGLHSFSTFQCTWEESHPAAELVTLLTCYWGTLSWRCAMHGSLQRLISTVFSVSEAAAGHGCASQVTGGNGFRSSDWLSITQALKDFWKHCCLCSPA